MSEYHFLPFQTSFEEPLKNPPNRRETSLPLISLIILYLYVSELVLKKRGIWQRRDCRNIYIDKILKKDVLHRYITNYYHIFSTVSRMN